jgi:hypothetical protein
MLHPEPPGPSKGMGGPGQVGECPGLHNNPDSRQPSKKGLGVAGIQL